MLTLVQNKILKSLKNDRPLAKMTADFRIFKTIHKSFLQEEERRRQNPRALKTAYNNYVKEQACGSDCDFVRAGLENDPGAEGIDRDEFGDNISDEEMDICMVRLRFEQEEERREAAMLAREAEAVGPVPAPGVSAPQTNPNPAAANTIILPISSVAATFAEPFPVAHVNPTALPTPTGNISNFPPKVPVIPHFPIKNFSLPTSAQGPGSSFLSSGTKEPRTAFKL
jgi:hypothetical protein